MLLHQLLTQGLRLLLDLSAELGLLLGHLALHLRRLLLHGDLALPRLLHLGSSGGLGLEPGGLLGLESVREHRALLLHCVLCLHPDRLCLLRCRLGLHLQLRGHFLLALLCLGCHTLQLLLHGHLLLRHGLLHALGLLLGLLLQLLLAHHCRLGLGLGLGPRGVYLGLHALCPLLRGLRLGLRRLELLLRLLDGCLRLLLVLPRRAGAHAGLQLCLPALQVGAIRLNGLVCQLPGSCGVPAGCRGIFQGLPLAFQALELVSVEIQSGSRELLLLLLLLLLLHWQRVGGRLQSEGLECVHGVGLRHLLEHRLEPLLHARHCIPALGVHDDGHILRDASPAPLAHADLFLPDGDLPLVFLRARHTSRREPFFR